MAITISGSGITSANIADGTIVNADVNSSAAIDASKLTGTGKVLQVVNHIDTGTTSITTTTWTDTGLSLSITPSSTSSKILVLTAPSISAVSSSPNGFGGMRVMRDASSISSTERIDLYSQYNHHTYSIDILDSPATTSAVTYKVQIKSHSSGITMDCSHHTNQQSITLMEIGA